MYISPPTATASVFPSGDAATPHTSPGRRPPFGTGRPRTSWSASFQANRSRPVVGSYPVARSSSTTQNTDPSGETAYRLRARSSDTPNPATGRPVVVSHAIAPTTPDSSTTPMRSGPPGTGTRLRTGPFTPHDCRVSPVIASRRSAAHSGYWPAGLREYVRTHRPSGEGTAFAAPPAAVTPGASRAPSRRPVAESQVNTAPSAPTVRTSPAGPYATPTT